MENKKEEPTLNKVTFVNGVQIKKQKWKALMWDNFIYYGKINQNRYSHKCTDGAFYKGNLLFNLSCLSGSDCLRQTHKNEKNMYSYKKIGNKYIVSINNHTEIVKALNAFCKEKGILSGSINGIGAIGELTHPFLQSRRQKAI